MVFLLQRGNRGGFVLKLINAINRVLTLYTDTMQLQLIPFLYHLKTPFVISRDTYSEKTGLIVVLSDGTHQGYGEACSHAYYGATVDKMIADLEALRFLIADYDFQSPKAFWAFLYPHLQHNPFALCAIDEAAHDLYGKKIGRTTYDIWGLSLDRLPISNYTIGIGSIDEMIQKVLANPYPLYKIKLGTDQDIEIIEALRQHTDAVFRIDANCAWDPDETIYKSVELKKLGVELIEQPLAANELEAMEKVHHNSALPLIADESCHNLVDIPHCYKRFDGINIKLMKCGGITPALKMIQVARQQGLSIMLGCMTESSIGISALAHLAPLVDYVDMDAALLISNDPATGAYIDNQGVINFPETAGLGIQINNGIIK